MQQTDRRAAGVCDSVPRLPEGASRPALLASLTFLLPKPWPPHRGEHTSCLRGSRRVLPQCGSVSPRSKQPSYMDWHETDRQRESSVHLANEHTSGSLLTLKITWCLSAAESTTSGGHICAPWHWPIVSKSEALGKESQNPQKTSHADDDAHLFLFLCNSEACSAQPSPPPGAPALPVLPSKRSHHKSSHYSRTCFSPSPLCYDLAQIASAPLLADRTARALFCRMNTKRICLSIWLARRSMIKSYVAHYRGKSKWEQCSLTIFRNNYLLIASRDLS